MIPVAGKGEVTILLSHNGGFIVHSNPTPAASAVPNIKTGRVEIPKVYTAFTIDEVMIIIREQIEALIAI